MLPRGQYCGDQLERRAGAVYDSPLQLPEMPMRQIRHEGTPSVSPADKHPIRRPVLACVTTQVSVCSCQGRVLIGMLQIDTAAVVTNCAGFNWLTQFWIFL